MKGEFLKKKIEDTGVPAVELASALGITPQNLNSKFKSDNVKVDFLLEVARYLEKDLEFFLRDLPEAKGISLLDKQKIDTAAEPSTNYGEKEDDGLLKAMAMEVVKHLKPLLKQYDYKIQEVHDRISLKEEMEALRSEIEAKKVTSKG